MEWLRPSPARSEKRHVRQLWASSGGGPFQLLECNGALEFIILSLVDGRQYRRDIA